MAIKYVLYNLKWSPTGLGEQPYQDIAATGATFSGGIWCDTNTYITTNKFDDLVYFGYIFGTSQQCNNAVSACATTYKMMARTSSQVLNAWRTLMPKNKQVEDNGVTYYLSDPYLNPDGTIQQDRSETPYL